GREEEGKKDKDKVIENQSLFIGANVFLMKKGEKVFQAGTLRLVPSRKPSAIDAAVKDGRFKGNTMLGVYQLEGDTLKGCFDPEGDSRPRAFDTKAGSARYVAVYKRVKPNDEPIDIVGKYRAESTRSEEHT